MGDALHGLWTVKRPHVDRPFVDWISGYLKFCIFAFELPWPGIERWGRNFNRLTAYLEHRGRLTAFNPTTAEDGQQRDIAEAITALNIRKTSPEEIAALSPIWPEDPEDEASAQLEAVQLMRTIMPTHVAQSRRPFDFSNDALGGRPSRGLYFGPTLPGFSYLHPDDPRRPK